MADRDEVRRARAYLLRVAEPPAGALHALVERVGPVAAAEAVRSGEVAGVVDEETSGRRALDLAAQDLADGAAIGARLVVPEDDEWPGWALLPLANAFRRGLRWAAPPLALWVRGLPLDELVQRAVAVVGSRSATSYGEHVAAEFGYGLAGDAGVTVVSGAAYGIDGAAHRGALNRGGRTVAVLACGVERAYPAQHARLLKAITGSGAVVSEYPPGTPPAKHRFLVRNRLVAGLAAGTVVVEAGVRSGARNTATTTAQLGKPLCVVPGPITSAKSQGCHELLRGRTAELVTSVSEVLEATGHIGELAARPDSPARATDGLGDQALRVHEALPRGGGSSPQEVAAAAGVPLERVRALLTELELTGLARAGEHGWRRATGGAPC
ncbi:DNA-processing protein DprA [Actinokineospora bangkokensis]|uniref:DNA protecting protein DprA n=1 Tax=Actinokineospora bangkokensis TaxID=1193682 RepID=A0A1Q9LHN2_9PSEU|nr:DNA-processing protein DprA [Actinokineospora bangkokensis]OLR91533.1 DNA protecting protein DprA [Actinokineospora bangkokensis]